MSDAELTFPQWQGPLQELVLEFDPRRLPEKIQSVETLVLERLQQLNHGNDSHVEKIALHDALSVIGIIKRDRLGSSGVYSEKAAVTLSGTVEKIIPPITPNHPEKAQISVEGAEDLYKEIRVDNTLQDESGNEVVLKKGAKVDVTIAADPDATQPKK
jgi:hypothetical protein